MTIDQDPILCTIVSYNAGDVKIYNSIHSLVRFKNKYIFSYFEKML
jgi:hypothetical protein